mmetsp:Transcript_4704/g.8956  ORF Transcript_4704/g.8956 Transcript_4704/m.8956 type:complete len:230 (-) Transcript_4704:1225-1914(-)
MIFARISLNRRTQSFLVFPGTFDAILSQRSGPLAVSRKAVSKAFCWMALHSSLGFSLDFWLCASSRSLSLLDFFEDFFPLLFFFLDLTSSCSDLSFVGSLEGSKTVSSPALNLRFLLYAWEKPVLNFLLFIIRVCLMTSFSVRSFPFGFFAMRLTKLQICVQRLWQPEGYFDTALESHINSMSDHSAFFFASSSWTLASSLAFAFLSCLSRSRSASILFFSCLMSASFC